MEQTTDIDTINSNNIGDVSVDDSPAYCGQGLAEFASHYRQIHGHLALAVCSFGLLTNAINICVLTRKEMVSPTNIILTGLAVSDTVVMFMYVPFTLHMYFDAFGNDHYSYGWAIFLLVYVHITQVFHTVSIWLTVTLAICRYISIGHPTLSRRWCTLSVAYRALVVAYVICPLICIPSYLTFTVKAKSGTTNGFVVGFSQLSTRNDRFLEKFNFWLYGVYVKLLPCFMLTGFSCCLVRKLVEAGRRRARLLQSNCGTGGEEMELKPSARTGTRARKQERQSQRTTTMLLAILILFLITELPQGILSLLSGTLGQKFHQECYHQLGDLMDILALFNSAVNFVFYCTMSSQFRDTAKRLLKVKTDRTASSINGHTPESTRCTRV